MSGTGSIGSLLADMVGEWLQLLGDIGGDIALLLDILVAPTHIFAKRHRSCQSYGLPFVATVLKKNLWRCRKPQAALRGIGQRDEQTRIALTGSDEQVGRCCCALRHDVKTACENQFLELALDNMLMECCKIVVIA